MAREIKLILVHTKWLNFEATEITNVLDTRTKYAQEAFDYRKDYFLREAILGTLRNLSRKIRIFIKMFMLLTPENCHSIAHSILYILV